MLVAASTHLSMLRLIIDNIMASFPSNFSQACIVRLNIFLVINRLVNVELCIARKFDAMASHVRAWAKWITV